MVYNHYIPYTNKGPYMVYNDYIRIPEGPTVATPRSGRSRESSARWPVEPCLDMPGIRFMAGSCMNQYMCLYIYTDILCFHTSWASIPNTS